MKKTRSIFFIGIFFALVLTFACLSVVLETPVSAATSGTTGDCTWTLEGTVLTISGDGEMGDYDRPRASAAPWKERITAVYIEPGVTSIGEYAFDGCDNLTSITIPDSVTSIGDCAFYNCFDLTDLTIPDSVIRIGSFAFKSCDGLVSISLPKGIQAIGQRTFADSENLSSITIPDSIIIIGEGAFENCESLTEVRYGGEESDRQAIEIGEGNDSLLFARWEFDVNIVSETEGEHLLPEQIAAIIIFIAFMGLCIVASYSAYKKRRF